MEKLWYTFRKLEQVPGTGITYEDFKKEFEIRVIQNLTNPLLNS